MHLRLSRVYAPDMQTKSYRVVPLPTGYPSVLRAANPRRDMIAAKTLGERDPETVIEKLRADPETEFLQARSADRACFTFAIARA